MLKQMLFVVLIAFAYVHAVEIKMRSINNAGSIQDMKIAGGVMAKPGDFPFLVALGAISDNQAYCCGALISKRWGMC